MQVRSDIVLVKPLEETFYAGPLVVARSEDDKTRMGKVIQVGPGRKNKKTGKRMPMDVRVGDKVLFGHHTGEDLTMNLNGEELLAMREPDILAVIE